MNTALCSGRQPACSRRVPRSAGSVCAASIHWAGVWCSPNQRTSSSIVASAVSADSRLQTTPLRVLSSRPVRNAKPSPTVRRSASGERATWAASATAADHAASPCSVLGGRRAGRAASHATTSSDPRSSMLGLDPAARQRRAPWRSAGARPRGRAPSLRTHAPSAVFPVASRAWRSSGTQPTSASTTSAQPIDAATWSAVPPDAGSRTFGSTPRSSNVCTASARPSRAASISATSASTRCTSAAQFGSPRSRATTCWASARRGSRSARSRPSASGSPPRAARSSALASRRARSRSILRSITITSSAPAVRGIGRRSIAHADRHHLTRWVRDPSRGPGCALVRERSLTAPPGRR